MAKEKTWGYHATEQARIFEIDRDKGETLPAGWVDTPAKLAPKAVEATATGPQANVAAPEAGISDAARIDELAAELAALTEMVKTLHRPAPKPGGCRRKRKAAKRERQEASSAGQPAKRGV